MRTMNTGFCTILIDAGADTLRLILRKQHESGTMDQFACALTHEEAARLIDLLESERRKLV